MTFFLRNATRTHARTHILLLWWSQSHLKWCRSDPMLVPLAKSQPACPRARNNGFSGRCSLRKCKQPLENKAFPRHRPVCKSFRGRFAAPRRPDRQGDTVRWHMEKRSVWALVCLIRAGWGGILAKEFQTRSGKVLGDAIRSDK